MAWLYNQAGYTYNDPRLTYNGFTAAPVLIAGSFGMGRRRRWAGGAFAQSRLRAVGSLPGGGLRAKPKEEVELPTKVVLPVLPKVPDTIVAPPEVKPVVTVVVAATALSFAASSVVMVPAVTSPPTKVVLPVLPKVPDMIIAPPEVKPVVNPAWTWSKQWGW